MNRASNAAMPAIVRHARREGKDAQGYLRRWFLQGMLRHRLKPVLTCCGGT